MFIPNRKSSHVFKLTLITVLTDVRCISDLCIFACAKVNTGTDEVLQILQSIPLNIKQKWKKYCKNSKSKQERKQDIFFIFVPICP